MNVHGIRCVRRGSLAKYFGKVAHILLVQQLNRVLEVYVDLILGVLETKNFTHIVTELTYLCGAGNSELGYLHSRSGTDREKCQNNLEVTQMIEGC